MERFLEELPFGGPRLHGRQLAGEEGVGGSAGRALGGGFSSVGRLGRQVRRRRRIHARALLRPRAFEGGPLLARRRSDRRRRLAVTLLLPLIRARLWLRWQRRLLWRQHLDVGFGGGRRSVGRLRVG